MKKRDKRIFRIPKLLVMPFLALMGYFLFTASNSEPGQWWYSNEVWFSNWRGVEAVDYSTNAPCATWYSKYPSKYFRIENAQEFNERPDTVTLGIDYYGFYRISNNVARFLPEDVQRRIVGGSVVVAHCYHGRMLSYKVVN